MFFNTLTTLIILFTLSVNGFAQDDSGAISAIDFTARDLNGKKVQLKKLLADGPVLLDFWALWCVPCLKEMPELNKISKKYKKRGLTILAINADSPSDQSKIKPFIKQKRFKFLVVLDEDKDIWNLFSVNALPTTILINQYGEIIYTHTGYKPGDAAKIVEKLEALFASRNDSGE